MAWFRCPFRDAIRRPALSPKISACQSSPSRLTPRAVARRGTGAADVAAFGIATSWRRNVPNAAIATAESKLSLHATRRFAFTTSTENQSSLIHRAVYCRGQIVAVSRHATKQINRKRLKKPVGAVSPKGRKNGQSVVAPRRGLLGQYHVISEC